MPKFTEANGVFFTESTLDMDSLGNISVRADTQNTSLGEVKREAAARVKEMGGNGLMSYAYSQKADNPFKDAFWFKWDSERITITGVAVQFPSDPRETETE